MDKEINKLQIKFANIQMEMGEIADIVNKLIAENEELKRKLSDKDGKSQK